MKLPRYWAKGTIEVSDENRQNHLFSCWGWSDESMSDAEKKGKAKASRLAELILKGRRPERYIYGDRPLREEILEEFRNRQGKLYAAVTRNSYGCHILNTTNIMFADVDLPQPTFLENLKHRLQKLLGTSRPPPIQQLEQAALVKLEMMIKDNPHLGVRVYRTRAGLRYLFTHDLVDPHSEIAMQTLKALEADPLYIKLCNAQESFRARLTPKPWRCGMVAPSDRWPWSSGTAEARFRQWEGKYVSSAQMYSTCRFIRRYGNPNLHPALTNVVGVHDRRTKATLEMKLA